MRCGIYLLVGLLACCFMQKIDNTQFLILCHKNPNQAAALGSFPSRSYQVPLAPTAVASLASNSFNSLPSRHFDIRQLPVGSQLSVP